MMHRRSPGRYSSDRRSKALKNTLKKCLSGRLRVVNAITSADYKPGCPTQRLPGKADSGSERILPFSEIAGVVASTDYPRREGTRVIRGNHIPRDAPAGWRIRIG